MTLTSFLCFLSMIFGGGCSSGPGDIQDGDQLAIEKYEPYFVEKVKLSQTHRQSVKALTTGRKNFNPEYPVISNELKIYLFKDGNAVLNNHEFVDVNNPLGEQEVITTLALEWKIVKGDLILGSLGQILIRDEGDVDQIFIEFFDGDEMSSEEKTYFAGFADKLIELNYKEIEVQKDEFEALK